MGFDSDHLFCVLVGVFLMRAFFFSNFHGAFKSQFLALSFPHRILLMKLHLHCSAISAHFVSALDHVASCCFFVCVCKKVFKISLLFLLFNHISAVHK